MKTLMKIDKGADNVPVRVSDEKAIQMVEAGTHKFVPKSEWKKFNLKVAKEVSK